MTTDQPQPWTCTRHGSRLQWRRDALVCPQCGPLHGLPAWPSTTQQQQQ